MSAREILASVAAEGQRLDRFVCAALPSLGRATARRLIEAGLVRVNGRRASAGARLRDGDRVIIDAADEQVALADPSVALRVCWEDAWLVAADKPAGIATHPLRPGELGTLASGLLARYPEMAGVGYSSREPGIVHRLDRDTSGLVLAARDEETFAALRALLEQGAIDKRYLAVCAGTVPAPAEHEAWLSARGRRVTVRDHAFGTAQPIRTELLEAQQHGAFSLVTVRVRRAHRHQIRAHLAMLGHPIAGDVLYGGPALDGLQRHLLHASSLRFTHPRTGAQLVIEAEPPAALLAALEHA
jgi:23S rRNA pseudouridine1911/1915/1917 synthase